MKSMAWLAAVLLWTVPSWATMRTWADQLHDIDIQVVSKPSHYIPEFDTHGAFNRGPVSMQAVALTFDDGPGAATPAVLEVLARHHAKATFFMVGTQVDDYPEYAKAVLDAGHEIGNHTFSHRNFCTSDVMHTGKGREIIRDEMRHGQESIEKATGFSPTLARMPYACRAGKVEKTVEKMGFTVVRWSVDGEDWSRPGTDTLVEYYLSHTEPGAVLLFHDGGGTDRRQTVAALERVLTAIEHRGLRYVTIGQMLNYARTDSTASAR